MTIKGNKLRNLLWFQGLGMEEALQEAGWQGRTWPARLHPIVPSHGIGKTEEHRGTSLDQIISHLPGDWDRPRPVGPMARQGRVLVEVKIDIL